MLNAADDEVEDATNPFHEVAIPLTENELRLGINLQEELPDVTRGQGVTNGPIDLP